MIISFKYIYCKFVNFEVTLHAWTKFSDNFCQSLCKVSRGNHLVWLQIYCFWSALKTIFEPQSNKLSPRLWANLQRTKQGYVLSCFTPEIPSVLSLRRGTTMKIPYEGQHFCSFAGTEGVGRTFGSAFAKLCTKYINVINDEFEGTGTTSRPKSHPVQHDKGYRFEV